MDNRLLRTLIYLFSGIILVFTLLILVNYLGSLASFRAQSRGREEAGKKADSAADMAQQALAAAKASGGGTNSMEPYSKGVSPSAVNSSGAIMLVKDKGFGGVAEQPKDMMSILSDLGGGDKRKPAPIALKDSDLDKKITVAGEPGREPHLSASTMPEMGRSPGQEGLTMLSAPVDYKIFKSSDVWGAFALSRKMKPVEYDFSSYNLLILISLSEFPSGIFSITGVEAGKKETVVKYRVNPLAMASESPSEQREAYARAPVPKGRPVRLEQVP